MRQILLALCLAIAVFAGAPAWAASPITTVFPPDNEANCTDAGQKFLSWYSGAGATHCSSGQEVLTNAIPVCTDGQQVVREGGKFVCKTPANVPSCSPNEFLNFDGQTYTCKSTGVATCANNQVLTFNGTSYFCVNKDATIPVCAANQFLTYNGSYQCAAVNTPAVPNCGAGQHVTGNGNVLYCAADTTTPMPGTMAGYCAQSWGGVEQVNPGATAEPAYFDGTPQGTVPAGFSYYTTTVGCSCRPGWSMRYVGVCNEGNCLDPSTGGTNVMYPAGVFYSSCIKN